MIPGESHVIGILTGVCQEILNSPLIKGQKWILNGSWNNTTRIDKYDFIFV